jgi:hypothetical protein
MDRGGRGVRLTLVLSAEQFDSRRAEFNHERPAITKPASASALYLASVDPTAALENVPISRR